MRIQSTHRCTVKPMKRHHKGACLRVYTCKKLNKPICINISTGCLLCPTYSLCRVDSDLRCEVLSLSVVVLLLPDSVSDYYVSGIIVPAAAADDSSAVVVAAWLPITSAAAAAMEVADKRCCSCCGVTAAAAL